MRQARKTYRPRFLHLEERALPGSVAWGLDVALFGLDPPPAPVIHHPAPDPSKPATAVATAVAAGPPRLLASTPPPPVPAQATQSSPAYVIATALTPPAPFSAQAVAHPTSLRPAAAHLAGAASGPYQGPLVQANWAGYQGAADRGGLARVALTPDGQSLIVVGSSQDPADPSSTDMVVGQVSIDGSVGRFVSLQLDGQAGVHTTGSAVAVDPTGTVYAVGTTNLNGPDSMLVARFSPGLTSVDWSVILAHTGGNDAGRAVALSGNTLLVGGWFDEHLIGNQPQNIGLAGLSGLSGAQPSLVFANAYHVPDGPSLLNDLVVDSQGQVDAVGTLQYNQFGDIGPTLFQIPSDYSLAQGWYWVFTGPGNSMNGVALDADGNVYAAGVIAENSPTLLLLTKYDSTLSSAIWTHAFADTGTNGDLIANGLAVDSAGSAYVAGIDTNGIFAARFSLDGGAVVGSVVASGNGGYDTGNGIAIDGAGNAYAVGTATSSDFGFASWNPVYGGGATDGIVMGLGGF